MCGMIHREMGNYGVEGAPVELEIHPHLLNEAAVIESVDGRRESFDCYFHSGLV